MNTSSSQTHSIFFVFKKYTFASMANSYRKGCRLRILINIPRLQIRIRSNLHFLGWSGSRCSKSVQEVKNSWTYSIMINVYLIFHRTIPYKIFFKYDLCEGTNKQARLYKYWAYRFSILIYRKNTFDIRILMKRN